MSDIPDSRDAYPWIQSWTAGTGHIKSITAQTYIRTALSPGLFTCQSNCALSIFFVPSLSFAIMRFSIVLLALAASTSAYLNRRQSLPSKHVSHAVVCLSVLIISLPDCAATCLATANLEGCQPNDNKCLCSSSAFVSSTTACIQSACSGSDLTNAEAAAREICDSVVCPPIFVLVLHQNLFCVSLRVSHSLRLLPLLPPPPRSPPPKPPVPRPFPRAAQVLRTFMSFIISLPRDLIITVWSCSAATATSKSSALSNGVNALASVAAFGFVSLAVL